MESNKRNAQPILISVGGMLLQFASVTAVALCVSGCVGFEPGQPGYSGTTSVQQKTRLAAVSDDELVANLENIARETGAAIDRREYLQSINTDPRMVVMGASTTYTGTFDGTYNLRNSTLHGSIQGSSYTSYHSYDANTGAQIAQGFGLLMNNLKLAKLEARRRAIVNEIEYRRTTRQNTERITADFLKAHPEVAEKRDLFVACMLITQGRTSEAFRQLQEAAEIMRSLPANRWIGWVEAHGIPGHPVGVVAGSYYVDVEIVGDELTGSGIATDGTDLKLVGKKGPNDTVSGTVKSGGLDLKFSGRMTENALSVDYSGTSGTESIRGITWAFR